jgi:hypothetical protein
MLTTFDFGADTTDRSSYAATSVILGRVVSLTEPSHTKAVIARRFLGANHEMRPPSSAASSARLI